MVAIGIDPGGTNSKAALVDKKKVFVYRSSVSTQAEMAKDYVFERIEDLVENLLSLTKEKPFDLYIAAKAGYELANEILRKKGKKPGLALANYIHILDISTVIVSDGVAKAGDFILKPAKETASRLLMPPFVEGFEILYESLGNDAALPGAASLAFEEL